jgi:iron complex outermembrane receptor protein
MIIAANGERTKNGVGLSTPGGTGKRYSLSFINQFADRKLGIALGYVHADTTSSSLASGSWGNSPQITDTAGVVYAPGTYSVPFAGGLTYETDHKTDVRDGLAAIFEFKPSDSYTSELDYYRARIRTALKKVEAQRGSNGANITNATISGGVVVSGTFAMPAYSLIDRNENLFDDDKIQSTGWKNWWKLSDTWSATLDINDNSAKRIERDIEAYAGIPTSDTLSFTNGGGTPQFTLGNATSYTDPNVIMMHDVAGWSGVTYPACPAGATCPADLHVPQAGYSKGPTVTDTLDAVRLDFTHNLGHAALFTDLQFGANYTKRTKERVTDEGLVVSATNGGYDPFPFPTGSHVESNIGGVGLNLLTFDPQANLWPGAVILRKYNDDILSKTWSVEEQVTTEFAKLNIDTQWGNMPVRGNVGLQVIETDQISAGYRSDAKSSPTLTNPAGTLRTDGLTFTDVLPSLNLTGDLGGGKLLRFGAGVQIARPNLTDMRNSLAASLDTNTGDCAPIVGGFCSGPYNTIVGSAGNPRLKPFKATAFDLSFEKYFQTKAYFSAAVFYKNLNTYITQATNYGGYDFTSIASQIGLTIPTPTAGAFPTRGGPLGTFTRSVNGNGGNLRGIELAASVPFGMMTHWLEGFGITASYSSTESSVRLPNLVGLNPAQQVPTGGTTIPLPGLSHINEKVVFYYERAGFSAFVADNKRSEYIGSVSNTTIGGYPALIIIRPQTWVSAQAGYEFQSGPLKGLGLRFEGNNMNKPIYKEHNPNGNDFSNKTGATYAFKLSYKY